MCFDALTSPPFLNQVLGGDSDGEAAAERSAAVAAVLQNCKPKGDKAVSAMERAVTEACREQLRVTACLQEVWW